MAKRRKEKDEEEDKPFKIPTFDKEAFLKRERRNIKTLFIAFLFAVFMAFICFGFFALMGPETDMRWLLVLLVAIASVSFIKYLFIRLNIDTSDFTKKNWFTTYATYIFAWAIVLIVLVNPPFYDDQDPNVELVVLPTMQEFGGDVKIIAKISDNAGVEKSGISLLIDNKAIDENDYSYEDNYLIYTFPSPSNDSGDITYNYEIKVKDINGIENREPQKGSFTFSNSTIRLSSHENAYSAPGPFVSSGTPITFEAPDNVDILYYTVNNGSKINATYDKGSKRFETSPEYEGWIAEQNVTITVYGQDIYNYDFIMPTTPDSTFNVSKYIFNNTIKDTQTYYFQVGKENIGLEESPEVAGPPINYQQVPGFETIIFIIALISVILIIRHKKKKDKKN